MFWMEFFGVHKLKFQVSLKSDIFELSYDDDNLHWQTSSTLLGLALGFCLVDFFKDCYLYYKSA